MYALYVVFQNTPGVCQMGAGLVKVGSVSESS